MQPMQFYAFTRACPCVFTSMAAPIVPIVILAI